MDVERLQTGSIKPHESTLARNARRCKVCNCRSVANGSFLALTLCNVLAAAAIPRHRQDPDTYPIIIQCLGQSTFLGSPTSRTVHRSPKTNRTTAHEHRLAHSPSHGRSGTLPSEVPQAVSRPSHSHTTNIPTGYHLVTTGSGHPRGETPLHLSYTHRNSDF